ncbi:hypothetical protein [Bacillus thuringiensis]|uniref:hypothetical protein n=1 Tax=Bacillus thuringiensis TaxID=1428 RepID=UPI001C54DF61|nr:hypothetical protein [Bacillus thuringiensis]
MQIGSKLLIVWLLAFLVTMMCYQAVQSILTSTMLLTSGTAFVTIFFAQLGTKLMKRT